MSCEETGLGARFGNDHVYPGDLFQCQSCGIRVIKTNKSPVHDQENKIKTIQMDEK